MKFVDPEILMGDVERRLGARLEALAPLCARAARMADATICDIMSDAPSDQAVAAIMRRMINALFGGVSGQMLSAKPAFAAALEARLRAEAAMAGVPLPPARRKI